MLPYLQRTGTQDHHPSSLKPETFKSKRQQVLYAYSALDIFMLPPSTMRVTAPSFAIILLAHISVAFMLPIKRYTKWSSTKLYDAASERNETSTQSQNLKELLSQIDTPKPSSSPRPRYQLGVGKNMPLGKNTPLHGEDRVDNGTVDSEDIDNDTVSEFWGRAGSGQSEIVPESYLDNMFSSQKDVPEHATRRQQRQKYDIGMGKNSPLVDNNNAKSSITTTRLLPKNDELSARLTKAVWDEDHFTSESDDAGSSSSIEFVAAASPSIQQQQQHNQTTITDYKEIDLSIPTTVYSLNSEQPIDLVWYLMRKEAYEEAAREPLLVSFLYSTIINHPTLESALSFHLANRLSNPAMLSTQVMSLIREALDADPDFRKNLRADMLAVRDRDPACNALPDVFLYFKGFHALQAYRVSHYLWKSGRRVLAHYLQSQVSQHFQIDIRKYSLP